MPFFPPSLQPETKGRIEPPQALLLVGRQWFRSLGAFGTPSTRGPGNLMPTDGLTTYGGQILERFYRQKTTKAEMLKKYQKDCLGFVDSWCLLFLMKRSVCFFSLKTGG